MFVYLLCFSISCLLIFYIRGTQKRSPKFIIGSSIALAIPCLLAALRSEQIGTDVRGYINPLYIAAKESVSIGDYWNVKFDAYRSVNGFEPGFNILVYISGKYFQSKQFLLGAIQFLTITPIYFGLKRFEEKIPLWLGMLIYYLMYYNVTLNMMRQWIAMAILFYAFQDLLNKKYLKYMLFILLGQMFHNSALIGILFIVLRFFYDKFSYQYNVKLSSHMKLSWDQTKELFLLLICCIVFFMPQFILLILDWIGLSDYGHYFYNPSTHFLVSQFIIRLPIVVLFLMNSQKLQHQMDYKFLFGMTICDIVFCNYVSGGGYMYRVACWFSGYNMYSYPMLIENFHGKKKQIVRILLVIYLVAYWWFYYCYKGSHETVPYVSIWG